MFATFFLGIEDEVFSPRSMTVVFVNLSKYLMNLLSFCLKPDARSKGSRKVLPKFLMAAWSVEGSFPSMLTTFIRISLFPRVCPLKLSKRVE